MVKNELPVKTLAEFIALAKKEPGKLSFGSGNGSSRGGAELFRVMAKIDLLGVPYKTQPQAVTDLMGGRIDIIFSDFTAGLAGGARRPRARHRSDQQEADPGAGAVPDRRFDGARLRDVGLDGGLCAGRHAAAHRRQAERADPRGDEVGGLSDLTRTTYGIPFPGTPEELAAFQASETKKWGEIVTVAGMKEP